MDLDGAASTSPNSGTTHSGEENIPVSIQSDKTVKTPLKKDELEKIAKQLKKKLSRASITAKQQISPNSLKINKPSSTNPSPLKDYLSKKPFDTPSKFDQFLSSSSPLYSPNNKSPTHMRSSAAASLLGSSPVMVESPLKNARNGSPSPLKPQSNMVLQPVATPTKVKSLTLNPSPPLSAQKPNSFHHRRSGSASHSEAKDSQPQSQTTPTLPKKQLASGNQLLKTPTQAKNGNGNYHDEEGADLLMYLATSPSPAKSYFPNTPKLNKSAPEPAHTNNANGQSTIETRGKAGHSRSNSHSEHFNSAPTTAFAGHKHTSSNSSGNSFIAPPPPLTPKRHVTSNMSSKTPQNRLTPSMNLFNSMTNNNTSNNASGLPSSGLALTPAGFNMNDYVNFFSPSPGGANLSRNLNNNFLKTPDFNNLLASANANGAHSNSTKQVDGKMINFDKVGLFKNTESKE